MTPKDFESFLRDEHAEDYHGTDDDMPDSYDNWLGELNIDEVIKYADEYGEMKLLQGLKEGKEEGQKEV